VEIILKIGWVEFTKLYGNNLKGLHGNKLKNCMEII
jgi:hypothetical protein